MTTLRIFLKSKYGLAIMVAVLMGIWNWADTKIAVHLATKQAANKATIASLEKELNELKRRELVAAIAAKKLRSQVAAANQETIKAQKEIMRYVETKDPKKRRPIDDDVFSRLRAN